jgi:tetratricopeptide (TPR) repeat protein
MVPPPKKDEHHRMCWVCHGHGLEEDGEVRNCSSRKLMRGCACRGPDAGFGHLRCLVQAAEHDQNTWDRCPTCRQDFTGELRLEMARARWEKAKKLPPQDWERLNAADRFAQALLVCSGDQKGALPLFEEVLATSRRVDGDDDVNTLVSMNNLASLHQKMGNHELALPLFTEALKSQKRTLGTDATDTLRTVCNLAMLHLRTEHFSLALPLAEESLEARQRTLGPKHVDTLESKHNLGLLRWHMAHGKYLSFGAADAHKGRCDLAELKLASTLLREVFLVRKPLLGQHHPLTKESTRALEHAERRMAEMIRASKDNETKETTKVPTTKKRRPENTNSELSTSTSSNQIRKLF